MNGGCITKHKRKKSNGERADLPTKPNTDYTDFDTVDGLYVRISFLFLFNGTELMMTVRDVRGIGSVMILGILIGTLLL